MILNYYAVAVYISYLQQKEKFYYFGNHFCLLRTSTSNHEERYSFRAVFRIRILHCVTVVNAVQIDESICVQNGSVEGTLHREKYSEEYPTDYPSIGHILTITYCIYVLLHQQNRVRDMQTPICTLLDHITL